MSRAERFTVGQRDYSLVVIPAEMENMDGSTLELLAEYLENGGKILSFNRSISRVDGEPSARVNDLAAKYPEQWIFSDNLEDPVALNMLWRMRILK